MPTARPGLVRLLPRTAPPDAGLGSQSAAQPPRFVPVSEGSAGAAQLHVAFGFRPCAQDGPSWDETSFEQVGPQAAAASSAAIAPSASGVRPLGPAPRRDHHSVQPYSRGSKAKAIAIASDPAARELAKVSLMGQAYTAGSTSAR